MLTGTKRYRLFRNPFAYTPPSFPPCMRLAFPFTPLVDQAKPRRSGEKDYVFARQLTKPHSFMHNLAIFHGETGRPSTLCGSIDIH